MIGLLLFAATMASGQPAPPAQPVVRQATATVRILAGARIGPREIPDEAQVRQVQLRDASGNAATARIVEFP